MRKPIRWLPPVILIASTAWLASAHQHEFALIITSASVAFGAFVWWWYRQSLYTGWLFTAMVIALHLSAFLSPPALSDDYHRFRWDGELAIQGENPYRYTPSEYAEYTSLNDTERETLAAMNSPNFHSVYPPVCQYLWAFSAFISDSRETWILVMRIIHTLLNLLTIRIMIGLLRHYKLPVAGVGVYALNPLVVVEGIANLHPELIMILFMALSFRLWIIQREKLSAVAFSLAVATKLLPLIVIPFLIKQGDWKKTLRFSAIAGMIITALWLPLMDVKGMLHILWSLDLYFRHFEFNASLYFIARSIGTIIYGYNQIAFLGPALALASALLILLTARLKTDLLPAISTGWMIYLLCATTVHPWYILPLVALSAGTGSLWPLIWSFTVLFSYSHYSDPLSAKGWIAAEYIVLAIALFLPKILNQFTSGKVMRTGH
jgi:alpha-1,6-mannosyltransferase